MTSPGSDTVPVSVVEVYAGAGGIVELLDTGFSANVVEVAIAAPTVVELVTAGPRGVRGYTGDPGEDGPPGPQGPQGVKGPPPPIFEQVFAAPSTEWRIAHGMGVFPNVQLVDTNFEEIEGTVQTPDKSTVVVTFDVPMAGTARLRG